MQGKFKVAIEQKAAELATKFEKHGKAERSVAVFTPRCRLLVLLRAVGREGREAIRVEGIVGTADNATYNQFFRFHSLINVMGFFMHV